jgi:hypothetical protein
MAYQLVSNTHNLTNIPNNNISNVINVNEKLLEMNEELNLPKELINSVINKWRKIFNSLLKTNKNAKILIASIETENFVNCRGVKFGDTRLSYDRSKKIFEIFVSPINKQDVLCFETWKQRKLIIKLTSDSLKKLFVDFFMQINKVHFCKDCGNFAYGTAFYEDLDKCETCLFEEITTSQCKVEEICAICQEKTKRWYKTVCGHKFHRKCLSQVIPNPIIKCPICRTCLDTRDEIFTNYLQSMQQDNSPEDNLSEIDNEDNNENSGENTNSLENTNDKNEEKENILSEEI